MAKQVLGLEQKQQQKLSPLQIQTIKLIELPVQELEQRVRAELEDNIVVDDTPDTDNAEEGGDISIESLKEDDYIPAYRTRVSNWGPDARPEYNTFSVKESFTSSLFAQLGYRRNLSEDQLKIAQYIIGCLNPDGYLQRDIESIVDDLAFRAGIYTDEEEVEEMLHVVQKLDPAGVGARNLTECLHLQLKSRPKTDAVKNAMRIVDDYFELYSNRHYSKIMSKMNISEDEFKAASAVIHKLNPSPGGQLDDSYSEQAQQIVPDFMLEEDEDGRLSFSMPRFKIPEIRIKREYSEMLTQSSGKTDRANREAAAFVKSKIDSAKWFVEALKQRQNTLNKTMQAILDYQYDYFLDGDDSKLRPMVLKDIAEKTGFDISTISRVVNSKYIETPFGIFQLKYFFSEGMENSDGNEVSTRELKKVLRDIVDAENKSKPLTDEQLVSEMKSRGYIVARRTIAKYRDQLGIPLARMRKEL